MQQKNLYFDQEIGKVFYAELGFKIAVVKVRLIGAWLVIEEKLRGKFGVYDGFEN